ncbi:MAG TPA: PfkB family carbohydrate kinase [Xanthobacteraceae bacterium]|jgi:2-dehydro-3-deoxygluconokinase
MSGQKSRVAVVGEVVVELAREEDGRFRLDHAGDTFNVAVYLARAGIATSFVTALGEDAYSDAIASLAAAEGIAGELMLRIRGRLPGLVLAAADASGARHADEWRGEAPVRELFELPQWGRLAEGLAAANLVYFSGITLSLYSNVGLGRFLATLEAIRGRGAKIAFDGNFRARGWRGDLSRARTVFIETLKRVDIALPAYDDEAVLWGDPSPEATVARLQAFGIGEIVVKNGPGSALIAAGGKAELVPVPRVLVPVDATAAGDGFNAAYIAARLSGERPALAAAAAHRLAGEVIRHRGALIPRTAVALH